MLTREQITKMQDDATATARSLSGKPSDYTKTLSKQRLLDICSKIIQLCKVARRLM